MTDPHMKFAGISFTITILILVSTLTSWIPTSAQTSYPPMLEPVILTDEQDKYPLGMHIGILEDPTGELTIEEVSSPEFDSRFAPNQAPVPNYGFTDSAYWVRFRLDNESHQIDRWLLEVGFANMHYIDLYTPLQQGEGLVVKQTGALRPVSTRDVLYPKIVFNLNPPAQSQQTYYLRFQNGASMTLPLTLLTQDTFLTETQLEQVMYGLYFGIILALLVYHLFLLFILREASYLYFAVVLASLLVEELSYAGYSEVYLIPNLYYLKPLYYPLSFSILIASIILFSDAFFELRTRLTKLHWVNVVLIAGWGVLILLTPFTSYHNIAILIIPWTLVSLMATWVAWIASWRQGFHPARFFMIAWLGMTACLVLIILVRWGIVPSTIFTENLYRLGMVWMAGCWSIALADRINLLKAETEIANRDLRTSEHRLSQILEGLPLGVILYGKDNKPKYANQRTIELFSNPGKGIQPDLSIGRTLAQAIPYFSLRVAGSPQEYPLENLPVFTALHGEPASADDIEMDRGDKRVALEIQASPIWDEAGNIDSAVVAIQDITQRKQAEAELVEYHKHLEELVGKRTAELNTINEQLNLHIDWLSAINQVNQILVSSADFKLIYEKIIEIINRIFSSQDSFIAALDSRSQQLKILAHSCHSDLHPDLLGSITSIPDPYRSDPNIGQGKLTIYSKNQLSSLSGPMGLHIRVTPIHSIVLVPILLRESVLGFLGLELHDKDQIITRDEISLLHIFAIDIAQLFDEERLYEQTKALITAEERNRLARDLHDSVTQVLFSIQLLAEVLPQIWRRDPEKGLQRLDKLQRLTRGALAEMRTMLLELRPSAVINTPLGDLLAQLTEAIASRSGLPFQLFIEQIPPLPENVQTSFYRIAQEALNNVVKHAQARQVTVSLSATVLPLDLDSIPGQEVKLVIQDDGVGYSSGDMRSDHMGINIMNERAAAIQARLSLESQPGYGTQVTLIWRNESGSL
jgi:signal transduction histidine kinase